MHDVLVVEAAHDVNDRARLADIAEELVAQAFALRSAFDEAGDVHEFDRGGDDGFRLDQSIELAEPYIRHRHDPRIGFDGAKRVVLGLNASGGQSIEDRALTDVGEADYSAGESHKRRMFPNPLGSVMSSCVVSGVHFDADEIAVTQSDGPVSAGVHRENNLTSQADPKRELRHADRESGKPI